jgi:hypothetical protein
MTAEIIQALVERIRAIVARLETTGIETSPGTIQQTMRDAADALASLAKGDAQSAAGIPASEQYQALEVMRGPDPSTATRSKMGPVQSALAKPVEPDGMPVAYMASDQMRSITQRELDAIPNDNGRRDRCKAMYRTSLYDRPSSDFEGRRLAGLREAAEIAEERSRFYLKRSEEATDSGLAAERLYGSEACEHLAAILARAGEKEE